MVDLGTLGGKLRDSLSQFYVAGGVNGRGQVIGMTEGQFSNSTYRAFVWQHGRMVGIGKPDGEGNTYLGQPQVPPERVNIQAAINERGQVVGTGENGFLWYAGRLTDLGNLRGGTHSQAIAINERGEVVGWDSMGANAESHAFLWNGRLHELAMPPRAYACRAEAINDTGQVAGECWTNATIRAVLWQGGRPRFVGPQRRPNYAYALSNRGQVLIDTVGVDAVGEDEERAYVWEEGTLTELPTPSGSAVHASAINEHNQIIGWRETKNYDRYAVLWTLTE